MLNLKLAGLVTVLVLVVSLWCVGHRNNNTLARHNVNPPESVNFVNGLLSKNQSQIEGMEKVAKVILLDSREYGSNADGCSSVSITSVFVEFTNSEWSQAVINLYNDKAFEVRATKKPFFDDLPTTLTLERYYFECNKLPQVLFESADCRSLVFFSQGIPEFVYLKNTRLDREFLVWTYNCR